MSSDAREAVFARLRRGGDDVTANDIARALQAIGPAPGGPTLPCADTCEAFVANVLANHGSVDFATDRPAAVRAIASYLYRHQRNHRIVAGNDPRLAAMPWRDAGVLPRFGSVEAGDPVGLSFARLGVAETGAVVTFTGKANPGANNLLPEHHLVLVHCDDIVATLDTAWQRLRRDMDREGRPRGINFLAGPSSTADIEGQLVYGAHGPRHWHIIVMGDAPAAAVARAGAAAPGPAQ